MSYRSKPANEKPFSVESLWAGTCPVGTWFTCNRTGYLPRYLTSAGWRLLEPLNLSCTTLASAPEGNRNVDFSQTGTVAYVSGKGLPGKLVIFWLDSVGKVQPLHLTPGFYFSPRFSPDGMRLAFSMYISPVEGNVCVKDIERDTTLRLTSLPDHNGSPVRAFFTSLVRKIHECGTGMPASGLAFNGAGLHIRGGIQGKRSMPTIFKSVPLSDAIIVLHISLGPATSQPLSTGACIRSRTGVFCCQLLIGEKLE